MRLDELFKVSNGVSSDSLEVYSQKKEGAIPFIRPASTQQKTLAGWVMKGSVAINKVFPKGTLFVSTDGEGSHTYSYVSQFEFVPNSNVSVLTPKSAMTLQEKVFYARCITMNRYRFSYGRKPKGERLRSIQLPDTAPEWVNDASLDIFDSADEPALNQPTPKLEIQKWKYFEYQELFEINRGTGPRQKDLGNSGKTPFITSTDSNNGLSGFTSYAPTHKGNTISVNRNGSVAEAFYQPTPFCSTEDVHIFTPKFELTPAIATFLITLIRKEKYRFGYGRKWGIQRMKVSTIKLPTTPDDKPDWQYMENYIKTLPYSSQI